MRIGLLGGTFNPIHFGHLHIAEGVFKNCHLEQVWFIPTCQPPHKHLASEISFDHRLEMVNLALAEYPDFSSCDIEGRRGGARLLRRNPAAITVQISTTRVLLYHGA